VGLTAAERARRVAALVAPKRSLANLAKRNLSQLAALVKTRLKRMQYRPGLLEGFLATTGLDLTPFLTPTIRACACRSWDGIAEPDADGGDVHAAAVDEVALVVAGCHGPVLAQLVDGPLDGVALFVQFRVEGWWPPAALATAPPVGGLVGWLGDDGGDVPAAQGRAGRLAGVGLIGQQPTGAGARVAGAAPGDA